MVSRTDLACPTAEVKCPLYKASTKQLVGWREWVGLPDLNVPRLKAKIDTGALTSAIHAFDIQVSVKNGQQYVDFVLYPEQDKDAKSVACRAPVIDLRTVTSSTGHTEQRYTIKTMLSAGLQSWPIELTLANRDEMGFRMLLGRRALRRRAIVDPSKSFCLSRTGSQVL